MTHRFFIPPSWIDPPTVQLSGETARQIKTVLRLRPGDDIIVLDNSGTEWQVTLTEVGQESIRGRIISEKEALAEPGLHLTLYQGTLKAQKFEWVLQKGTELGVSQFVPTVCQRSVINDFETLAKKRERWQRIIQEAAEQSGRGKLPQLEQAISLAEAVTQAQARPLAIMPWEEATGHSLKEVLAGVQVSRLALIVGPEGGFTAEEAALAQSAGIKLVKLGPRILRAETAGIATCGVILYEMDQLGTDPTSTRRSEFRGEGVEPD